MSDIYEKRSRVKELCDGFRNSCMFCPCHEQGCCVLIEGASEKELDAMLKAFEGGPVSMQPKEEAPKILDSGERTEYETGAVRDCKEGKGRCDLMPLDVVAGLLDSAALDYINDFEKSGEIKHLSAAITSFSVRDRERWGARHPEAESRTLLPNLLLEVSKHFEEGAKKYGPGNWQKGIPVHSYIDSAIRHYLKFRAGWTDEPHDRAFVWNLMCCIWTMEHHPELDDFTDKRAEK